MPWLLQKVMDKKGYTATCAVLITFRHGGCSYAVFGSKKQFTSTPPSPPPSPPPPPPLAPSPSTPTPPDACECEGDSCADVKVRCRYRFAPQGRHLCACFSSTLQRCLCSQVCSTKHAKVHLASAKVYLSKPAKCLKGKRFMFLNFTLRDMHSDTGVKRVNLFVKSAYAKWLAKRACALAEPATMPLTMCKRTQASPGKYWRV